MHPIHTLRRPVTPPAARNARMARARLGSLLLWLIVLVPLAWGVYETWQDIGRFLN